MFEQFQDIPYQAITDLGDVQLMVKRLDLVHPSISGNKFFKLKYNLIEARKLGYTQLLSFGGAYSNHIYALAHAAQQYGFESIGIIRGEELQDQALNPMLATASTLGMQLQFISRQDYRRKHTPEFLAELQQRYPNAYIIPEGGSNDLAIQGTAEILTDFDRENFDVICCAVGTGGTITGLINASSPQQKVIGFSALKGDFLDDDVRKWTTKNNWQIYSDNTFGGYAKYDQRLLNFMENMQQKYQLPLEPIYTGKAFYQLWQLIQQHHFTASTRILFIHTGGLHKDSSD
ncbi:D-cysteine desulfhydrase [Acinetobacter marinus]|uniref:D-cysteine desulfhydrase n=1 Tax=Acinetobacter marinus TaxID=281375 RepID=A0A1G6M8K7_9GAMM|nr:pyridoxal-phosphate dependent enzyme [Acinetobacter marinus]SDC51898.1 D-cysteine desulfhydrase [Acinetobacter marinus]